MQVWRICREKHAADPLSGEGARLYGGRWNHKGTPLVYCAGSLALAALEVLIHADPEELPSDLVKICIEISDAVPVRKVLDSELPSGWNAASAPSATKDFGGDWIAAGTEAVLIVPSAVIQEEMAVLINPAHPGSTAIKVISTAPFSFDSRLRK